MAKQSVSWRVQLASPVEKVFAILDTDTGRASFWADSAVEQEGVIHFRFNDGTEHTGRIRENVPHRRFAVEYFGGSIATFTLKADEAGGTVLTLEETGIPADWWVDHYAGWVSVLLTLKAAVDFGIDLRNKDPQKNWGNLFVDV